jgi:hypothetical protein
MLKPLLFLLSDSGPLKNGICQHSYQSEHRLVLKRTAEVDPI